MLNNRLRNNTHSKSFKIKLCILSTFFLSLFTLNIVQAESNVVVTTANQDTVYTVVDVMPEVEGGISEIYKFIEYPREAQRRQIEGRVFVKFIVNEKGGIESPEILKDIGAGCGDAAIEGIKRVNFKPGRKDGQAVKVFFTIPVTFKLEN